MLTKEDDCNNLFKFLKLNQKPIHPSNSRYIYFNKTNVNELNKIIGILLSKTKHLNRDLN